MCFEDERLEVDIRTEEQLVRDVLEIIQRVQTQRKLADPEYADCLTSLLRLKEKVAVS